MTEPTTMAVVATCYDRWDFLERTLPTWRRLFGKPPVFVGTYADEDVPAWATDTYRVVVRGDPFHRTRLLNCVASAARRRVDPEYLLFLDADIEVVDPEVFVRPLSGGEERPDVVLDSPFALVDEYVLLRKDDPERTQPGKRGTALVRTELFFDLGGYDQRMLGWGMDDRNLYQRCRDAGAKVAHYDRAGIVHIEHSEELRYRHNPGGGNRIPSLLANLKRHLGSYDLRGESWRDELGYPDFHLDDPSPVDTAP